MKKNIPWRVAVFVLFTLLSLSCIHRRPNKFISKDGVTVFTVSGNIDRTKSPREAWVKKSAADGNLPQFRIQEISMKARNNLSYEGYENYLYTMDLWQFDCSAGKYRVIQVVDYDISGQVLNNINTLNTAWVNVIPGSIGEALFKACCD